MRQNNAGGQPRKKGGDKLAKVRTAAVALVLILGVLLLTGCGLTVGSDTEAQRIRAQAELERQRSENRQIEREQAHRQALETLPLVVAIIGGLLATAIAGGVIVWQMRQPPRPAQAAQQPQAPAALPAVNVFVLQPGQGSGRRADQWRGLQAEAERLGLAGGNRGEVIVYDDRQRL